MNYKYDSESDILSITVSDKPFDYAEEIGDFVVHFDKRNKPVYLEILNARSFLTKATTALPYSMQRQLINRFAAM